MTKNKPLLPSEIYQTKLQAINGVKFSQREVDVIACILEMRTTKKIAQLLSIAPKTIESHIRNISKRLNCNSREGIISFIEGSDKYLEIKNYYAQILILKAFESEFVQVCGSILNRTDLPTLVYEDKNSDASAIIFLLKKHIELVGLRDVSIILESSLSDSSKSNIILTGQIKDNYYLEFFNLLERLCPDLNIEGWRSQFEEQCQRLLGSTPPVRKSETTEVLLSYKRIWLKSLGVLIIIGLIFSIFIFQQPASSIRSDLIIPAELFLLNRPLILEEMSKKLESQNGIRSLALIGIGGSGKTTLARQYAVSQNASVVWEFNAESSETLKSSIESLAHALSKSEEDLKNLREAQNIKDKIIKREMLLAFVQKKLRALTSWVIIFDNVEKFQDIKVYYPSDPKIWGNGKVILTTQDHHIQQNNQIQSSLEVGALEDLEKLDLFMKIIASETAKPFSKNQIKEIKSFLAKLPPFPLDISVAGYYLKVTQIPYSDYLNNLRLSDATFNTTEEYLIKDATNYSKIRYKIITTSLDHLMTINEDFSDLLLLVSFVDSQDIPRDLLVGQKASQIVDSFIYNLRKYSLITKESSTPSLGPTISIHRSLQSIQMNYLIKKLNIEDAKKPLDKMILNFEEYLKTIIDDENLSKMNLLVLHCESFLRNIKSLNFEMESGQILSKFASIYYYLGNHDKAEELLEESLRSLNKNKPINQDRIAWALAFLGDIHRFNGNYKYAKYLLQQSLDIYKIQDPRNYEKIAWVLTCMAKIYWDLCIYNRSKDLLEEALAIYQDHPPKNIEALAWTLGCLGNTYRDMGDYAKAKPKLEDSLKIYKDHFSEDTASYAWALVNLGELYQRLGNYERARNLTEQGLGIYKSKLSKDNIRTAWVATHLGSIYRDLGNHNKAIQLLESSLAIYKAHFVENHLWIAWNLSQLGKIYAALGQNEKAKQILMQSLKTYTYHSRDNCIESSDILRVLSQISLEEGNFEKAEVLLRRVKTIIESNSHPNLFMHYEVMAELNSKKSRQALKLGIIEQSNPFLQISHDYLQKALRIVQASFPKDSPHIKRIQEKLKKYK
jgi:tetratricopeptide (TPR) repeat protein/DNA-binding CsgD family transcriptional regulator